MFGSFAIGRVSTVAFVAAASTLSRQLQCSIMQRHGGGSVASSIMKNQNRAYSRTVATSLAASTPQEPTIQYLLQYKYISDVLEKRGPYRADHIDLAKQLVENGKCISGGPCGPPDQENPTGALFIFTDEKSAKQFVDNDPYVSNGIVTDYSIEKWTIVVQ